MQMPCRRCLPSGRRRRTSTLRGSSATRLTGLQIEEVQAAEIDRELDRVVRMESRAGLEPRHDGGALATRVDDLGKVARLLAVDEPLEHVVGEHGPCLDLD